MRYRLLDRGEGEGDKGEAARVLARLLDDDKSGNGKIRCPGCGWKPRKDSLWSCSEPCFHTWNTFDTRGRCPGCSRQWTHTACLQCSGWFLHEDWYVKPDAAQ